jgi:hypothetical protein
MHEHDPEHWQSAPEDRPNDDHWAMFAEAMDLTIEGHRLIAQEIVYETKVAWRGMVGRLRALTGTAARRRSSPPA